MSGERELFGFEEVHHAENRRRELLAERTGAQEADRILAVLAASGEMRRANQIRRLRTWLDAPRGQKPPAVVELLANDGLRPWLIPHWRTEEVLVRALGLKP